MAGKINVAEKAHDDDKVFGFWVYLMTDLIIFGVLFAAFIVLRFNTFSGPTAKELFEMPSALKETLILLTSSFTCALASYFAYSLKKKQVIFWLAITCILGVSFLFLEATEFKKFILKGAGPSRSAFLSSFFALVGTHGFHVSIGILWMIITMFTIGFRELTKESLSRLFRVAYFWHFLDVIWIFIFTVVYGMGHLI